jgi:hypothetical protein
MRDRYELVEQPYSANEGWGPCMSLQRGGWKVSEFKPLNSDEELRCKASPTGVTYVKMDKE